MSLAHAHVSHLVTWKQASYSFVGNLVSCSHSVVYLPLISLSTSTACQWRVPGCLMWGHMVGLQGLPAMGAVLSLGAGWPASSGSPRTSQVSNRHLAMQLKNFFLRSLRLLLILTVQEIHLNNSFKPRNDADTSLLANQFTFNFIPHCSHGSSVRTNECYTCFFLLWAHSHVKDQSYHLKNVATMKSPLWNYVTNWKIRDQGHSKAVIYLQKYSRLSFNNYSTRVHLIWGNKINNQWGVNIKLTIQTLYPANKWHKY